MAISVTASLKRYVYSEKKDQVTLTVLLPTFLNARQRRQILISKIGVILWDVDE